MREETFNNSNLQYLEEHYSVQQLLDILDEELSYQNEIYTESENELMYQVLADWNGDFVFMLWNCGAITISNGEVSLDKELLS